MDSMRSLNTSLPRTSPQRKQQAQQPPPHQQPDDILSAFKAAALSVTNLYKTAASLTAPAKASGYQAALEDLLTFLDKQNLGLGDGEGWRVRQWATERLDGPQTTPTPQHDSDNDEDEGPGHAQDEREDSVGADGELMHKEDDMASSGELPPPPPPAAATKPEQHEEAHPLAAEDAPFTFRSPHVWPANHARDASMEVEQAAPARPGPLGHRAEAAAAGRAGRAHRQRRAGVQRAATSTAAGGGAGSKRKFPLGDFFDLSGINFDGKDTFDRGNKRRHI